ncbi:hypothetical protein HELRODRAFT_165713 [Helobdella robusta]|uniref:Uncharacterized protein n=1 Tax=Helobdella robusta TaxID=6412 RepID=T1EX73_HELRO|nr:hypothetical protein HELRODRAFT_165713 [Helobdella robusta]ESN91659.1 hypothetical protein HELRODRAFT_165713 [Helobdella robusta]
MSSTNNQTNTDTSMNNNRSLGFRQQKNSMGTTYLTEESYYNRFDSGICLSYQSQHDSSSVQTSSNIISPISSLYKSNDLSERISDLNINQDFTEFMCQNGEGDTPLHIAVIKNDQNLFWKIMDSNPAREYLNLQNFEFLQTPLHLAVETEMTSIIEGLVAMGAATNVKDRYGNTPLHIACMKGDFVSVTRLMMHRNKTTENPSAHQKRQLDVLFPPRWLTGCYQDCDDELTSFNYNGKSCLHLALEREGINRMRIIKFLVCQCSADVNVPDGKSGYTILHELVRLGDVEAIKQLLTLPIPDSCPALLINPLNYERRTPLDMAYLLPSLDVRQMMVDAGGVMSSSLFTTSGSSPSSLSSSSSSTSAENP